MQHQFRNAIVKESNIFKHAVIQNGNAVHRTVHGCNIFKFSKLNRDVKVKSLKILKQAVVANISIGPGKWEWLRLIT